ncbi:MAG: peptide chain release factor 2 [Desulfobacterales bacterium]|nr:peptide chain release factor 2 [Desulfobacterales bacterium]MDD4072892.1 peptide chain release factor 2 [Desulfobacterales bacterium]MDD4392617.1 peptide chain release factor 2 [Desulfobacterales bacterium]
MSLELKQTIKDLYRKIEPLKGCLDLADKEKRLKEIEAQISRTDFWDNPEATKAILKERTVLTDQVDTFRHIVNDLEETGILLELALDESNSEAVQEVTGQLEDIDRRIRKMSLDLMLSGENDANNAIVSINAGAGGTEAQDWAEMLYRMYLRWVERRGFKIELIDFQPGDEAGIKSVTFTASGPYAYGYLKAEVGIHRLVRISPFNASGKRHTSFAAVFVYPELDEEIVIDIEEKDLRIDVFRASGAGGQHVNKTSSAIRITHLPTGIVVQCQQEKSQHRNKDLAMKVLNARLYQHEKQKQDDKMQQIHDSKSDIAWGNQIRSYVLHPYQMAKDHRTNIEIGNVNAVLDGAIDPFIEGMLLSGKH